MHLAASTEIHSRPTDRIAQKVLPAAPFMANDSTAHAARRALDGLALALLAEAACRRSYASQLVYAPGQ